MYCEDDYFQFLSFFSYPCLARIKLWQNFQNRRQILFTFYVYFEDDYFQIQSLIFQLSVIRENQVLAKSKRAGSPFLDWTTLDTNVERKRKWVDINDLIDTDSPRVKKAKQELLEALLEQEGLC